MWPDFVAPDDDDDMAPDDDEDGRLLNCVVREADDGMLTPVASLGLWVTVPL
jgi:hypothetical protein